jgi:hypothetical protein
MKPEIFDGLPGADLIEKGLADHANMRRTPEACLVEMASPRLVVAGLLAGQPQATDSELTLYHLLGEQNADPYPLYNSLDHRLRKTCKQNPEGEAPPEPMLRDSGFTPWSNDRRNPETFTRPISSETQPCHRVTYSTG